MKKLFVGLFAAVIWFSFISSAVSSAASDDNLRFVVMGDSRPILGTLVQSPPFKQILWETDLLGPDLAVHVGDLVFGYMSEEGELSRQYEDLDSTLKTVRTPMHFAIGNHEIGSEGGEGLFVKNVNKLYYSFDAGNSHFIILDSDWGGTGDSSTFGKEQVEWLKGDLAAHRGAKNVFAFMHKPMFESKDGNGSSLRDLSERDKVHKMFLDAGNVKVVFAGHIHDYRHIEKDGIPYYVTGGAGAETQYPERNGFYHYLLVDVAGGAVTVKVVEPYHMWYTCEPECDGTNSDLRVSIVNTLYSLLPLRFSGVLVNVPTPPAGKRYRANGGQILKTRDNGDGTTTLQVSANMNSVVGYKYFDLYAADE